MSAVDRHRRRKYAVREIRIPEGEWHTCTSVIVALLQSSYNAQRKTWYLTALIEREPDDVPT